MAWRMGPEWWMVVGTRVYDETCDPDDQLPVPSDQDTDFSDLDREMVQQTTRKLVNGRMQMFVDYLKHYKETGFHLARNQDLKSTTGMLTERAKDCEISNRLHNLVNSVHMWLDTDNRFDCLVERLAEEVVAGRVRHLVKLGYMPQEYAELYECIPSIIPYDPKYFLHTDNNFCKIHKARTTEG